MAPGQTLALIDDGGAAATATVQAEIDLETALLELPPNVRPGGIHITRRNVTLAKQRLIRARAGRPRRHERRQRQGTEGPGQALGTPTARDAGADR